MGKCFDEVGNEIKFTPFDQMPGFPGGDEARMQFIRTHLHYPIEAAEKGEQGKVVIRFKLNPDGVIDDQYEVTQSVSALVDRAAAAVIAAMPPWTPGMQIVYIGITFSCGHNL